MHCSICSSCGPSSFPKKRIYSFWNTRYIQSVLLIHYTIGLKELSGQFTMSIGRLNYKIYLHVPFGGTGLNSIVSKQTTKIHSVNQWDFGALTLIYRKSFWFNSFKFNNFSSESQTNMESTDKFEPECNICWYPWIELLDAKEDD